ncbi:hypothetical protein [Streptomyces hygroscopicus]|uniref:hypothetical protein n=1 Tax=Streptomyces hygroscopicus TaxID=1912 RepID=UPI001FCBD302|nr:hypothetical protein [Streptomyces hygroscopicus]BDH12393.1 hypothetical protein HOK021_35720 [Streptomyces hygroscopicus]
MTAYFSPPIRVAAKARSGSVRLGQSVQWWPELPADPTQLGESRLALALCHHDGRIRQEAVGQSARYPGLLPLVVIRYADWVGPVRERARQLLREALDVDSARDLAPLILRVGAFRLLDAHGGIVALRAVVGLLEDPDVKLRTWAGQSVERWHPSADVRCCAAEVGNCSTEADTSSATTCCTGARGRPGWAAEYAGKRISRPRWVVTLDTGRSTLTG